MSGPVRYTCEKIFRLLDRYVDRDLSGAEHDKVLQHLDACARCASEFEFEVSLVEDVRSKLSRIDAPAELLVRIDTLLRGSNQ